DDRRITYPSTSVGQGGRTGLRNVGAFFERMVAAQDSSIRLDPSVRFERPANYQPPTRGGRLVRGRAPPGARRPSREARIRAEGGGRSDASRNAGDDDRPAREMLRQFEQRDRGGTTAPPAPRAEPRPQTQGGGATGRVGW